MLPEVDRVLLAALLEHPAGLPAGELAASYQAATGVTAGSARTRLAGTPWLRPVTVGGRRLLTLPPASWPGTAHRTRAVAVDPRAAR